MDQVFSQTALNKNLIMGLGTESHESQVQTSESSESATTDPHAKCTTPYVRALLQAELSQFRAMTQTPGTCAAALSAIDEEIDAAHRFTHSLLSRRNVLAPISVLPTELLARIFHFCALAEPLWMSQLPSKLGWITVTHVCQRWRQVALDDTSLWARITGFSRSPKWIAESLARARNAPLVFSLWGRPSPEILANLQPHISHTRELQLGDLSMHHSREVQEIFGLEAPALEHFGLWFSEYDPGGSITFPQISGTELFKGRAPKLRTFTLSEVFVPWSLIPRGQLTRIQITRFKGIPTTDVSLSDDLNQLVDLLISSPELEVLILEFCLPTMLSQVSHGQLEPIHLPRLSRLHLGGSTTCVTNFFKRLTLPSSAILCLQCISGRLSTHNDHLILPLISAHFHNSTPVEFKNFRVTADHMRELIEVAASNVPPGSTTSRSVVLEDDMDNEAEQLKFSLEGMSEHRPYPQAEILGRICSTLPISNVEVLSISASETILSVNWYQLFQRCKKITTIQVQDWGGGDLLQSLAPQELADTPSNRGPWKWKYDNSTTHAQVQVANNAAGGSRTTTTIIPFPKLTSLSLGNLNFNRTVTSGVLFDVFVNALQWRKTNALPLSKLTIRACTITAEWADCMKKHVQEFDWDGQEDSYDPWEGSNYSLDDVPILPSDWEQHENHHPQI